MERKQENDCVPFQCHAEASRFLKDDSVPWENLPTFDFAVCC